MSGPTSLDAYVALIEGARRWQAWPWSVKSRVGAREGRLRSFLLQRREAIESAMQWRLRIDAAAARASFQRLCESTGVASHMVWHLPRMNDGWLARNVRANDPAPLRMLAATGGLVVSHHSYHQNLLPVSLRIWGIRAHPVARSPALFSQEAFGGHRFLQEFTQYLDRATVAQLDGAQALYIDQGRAFLRAVREAWARQEVVFMCSDFDDPQTAAPPCDFLGQTLQPPAGLFRLALEQGVPVHFAGMAWQRQCRAYELELQPLDVSHGLEALARDYVAHLQGWIVRSPWAWQGWENAAEVPG